MKRILFLLLASALQAVAQTGTPPSSLPTVSGSLSSGYYYVVLGTDNELHIATAAQMEAQAQSGVLLSSSINGTALTALGNSPNGTGGILTFGAIGSNVEAWSSKLDTLRARQHDRWNLVVGSSAEPGGAVPDGSRNQSLHGDAFAGAHFLYRRAAGGREIHQRQYGRCLAQS